MSSLPQLIDATANNITTAVTNHTVSTSSSTLPGDLLFLACFFQGSTDTTTPTGWIRQNIVQGSPTNTPTAGTFVTYFKYASVTGSETVTVSTFSGNTIAIITTFTIRGVRAGYFANFDFSNTNSSTTYTTPSDSTPDNYDGVLVIAANDDTTSETWSISPSLTQQAFGYVSGLGQMSCYLDVLPFQGSSMSYAITKTGAVTAGIAALAWFAASPVVIDGIPANVGAVGSAYSSSVTASGGQGGPYTFSVLKGQLPVGLALNSSTGALTGTPTTGGYYSFLIQVQDSAGQVSTQTANVAISGGSPPPAGSPSTAFVFSFTKAWTSTRSSGAPGQGVWTTPVVFNDNSVSGFDTQTFSAGGDTSLTGVVGFDGGTGKLVFFGAGTPSTPHIITFFGQLSSTTGSSYFDASQGAWDYGGNLYIFVNNFGSGLWMIKSTDGGVTWVGQDTSHSPEGHTRAAVQRVGNAVVVFSSTSVGPGAQFQVFDMTTDTWSAPFGYKLDFPLQDFGTMPFMSVVFKYFNGDYGVVYNHDSSGSGTGVVFQLYTQLGWSLEIYIPYDGSPNGDIGNAILDPVTEIIHLFMYGASEDPGSIASYSTIAHDGRVEANLFTFPAQPDGGDGFGHPSIQGGLLLLPYDDFGDGSNVVWVATLGTSTFYPEFLPIPDGEWGSVAGSDIVVHDGGSGYVLGDTGFVGGGDGILEYQVTQVDSGAATRISLRASGANYLPAVGVTTTNGSVQPGSGSGLTVTIVAVQPSTPSCSYMSFPNSYTPLPYTVSCPAGTAKKGRAYSGIPAVVGGTPPYTWFVWNGTLPPGLTLDPTTGAITGSPTSNGTFQFSIGVIDANGNFVRT